MDIFLSPHNDDETLFGAFTIMRHKPQVVVVYDGYLQGLRGAPITAERRRDETRAALAEMNAPVPVFFGFSDACWDIDERTFVLMLEATPGYDKSSVIFAPAPEIDGHAQHTLVGNLAAKYSQNVVYYMTYTRTGGKSTGQRVPTTADMICRKLRALACYRSQIELANTREHFLRDLNEYYLQPQQHPGVRANEHTLVHAGAA